VKTAALESKPDYVKAIHRRATANEAIGKWGSLQSALDGAHLLLSPFRTRRFTG
jgi:hypothetical protein